MHYNVDKLIEAVYFRNYELDRQIVIYKRRLKNALAEFPQEFSSHFQAHNNYHDWNVASLYWDRLHSQITLSLLSPSRSQPSERIDLTFSDVTICEILKIDKNNVSSTPTHNNQFDSIYTMYFAKNRTCGHKQHSHTYSCVIRFFGDEMIKFSFAALSSSLCPN